MAGIHTREARVFDNEAGHDLPAGAVEFVSDPNEADRIEGRRHSALHQAIEVVGREGNVDAIVDTARKFEAFLKGE